MRKKMNYRMIAAFSVMLIAGMARVASGADIFSSTPNHVIKLPEGGKYSSVHIGDLNNDGKPDILVCAYANGKNKGVVFAYLQKNGTFCAEPDFSVKINEPRGAVIKDIDGDGENDFVVNSYRKRIYICYAKNKFKPIEYCDTNMRSDDLLDVDLNKNLKLSASLLGRAVWWRIGSDGIVRQTYIARPPKNDSAFPAAGDLNGDENVDLVYPQRNRLLLYYGPFPPLSVLRPKTLTEFSIIKQTEELGVFQAVRIADCNGDAKADIAVLSSKKGIIFYNQGSPMGFSDKVSASIAGGFWKMSMLDVDGDGLKDIVAIDKNTKKVRVFRQKKDGGFAAAAKEADQIISGEKFYKMALADINGDGRKDLVVSTSRNSVVIYFNVFEK